MRAFQIVIDRRTSRAGTHPLSSIQGVVDVLVDGANVTARIGQDHALPLLRDMAFASAELASGKSVRTTVRFYDQRDAWALGLERVGDNVLLTVFQGGAAPQVAVYERPVRGDALLRGIQIALREAVEKPGSPDYVLAELNAARAHLDSSQWGHVDTAEVVSVDIDAESEAPLSFCAGFPMRCHADVADATAALERNDLHSLLVKGRFRVHVGDFSREIGDTYVFLVAETLVREAGEILDGWVSARAVHHRSETAGVFITTRLTSDGNLTLGFGGPKTGGLRNASSFPAITVPGFVEAVIALGRAVARGISKHDRTQTNNLRMRLFRDAVRDLADELREAVREDAKYNPAPESYRAYADVAPARDVAAPMMSHGRLRFSQAWQAAVPGVDLHSVFLLGERLVVGGARELASIDRATGKVMWRVPADKGVSVAAPSGIARLCPDGNVSLVDLETGEKLFQVRLNARVGGAPAGALVNAPGLPRLLIVSEGERHITAVDMVSGEVRWRRALGRGRYFKVRRAGKLLIVSSSEPTLSAIDVTSGEEVWRVRDRLRFCRPSTYDNNALFVVSGDASTTSRGQDAMIALDPWTGIPKWRSVLPAAGRPVGAPLTSGEQVISLMHDQRGLGFACLDRSDGSLLWNLEPGFAPAQAAALVVDDQLIVNAVNGDLSSIDLKTNQLRWQKHFGPAPDGDTPRHLDPILRAGALFVPQHNVAVVRPSDGETLGQVPTDLVPDLVRVDERCNLVVVEDSGHVACFTAGARLTLVKG